MTVHEIYQCIVREAKATEICDADIDQQAIDLTQCWKAACYLAKAMPDFIMFRAVRFTLDGLQTSLYLQNKDGVLFHKPFRV